MNPYLPFPEEGIAQGQAFSHLTPVVKNQPKAANYHKYTKVFTEKHNFYLVELKKKLPKIKNPLNTIAPDRPSFSLLKGGLFLALCC